MPSLLLDRCLSGAPGKLVEFTAATFEAGHPIVGETITMPRGGFGPRPVTIFSPAARTLYAALVKALEPALPEPTRTHERWQAHSNFGAPGSLGPEEYLVEFDIASCYEYIDHQSLRDELIFRSLDVARVEALVRLLTELYGRPRGLPQLTPPSDILADTYLDFIERQLLRAGRTVSRYVDDFGVVVDDWGLANSVIEEAAEFARQIGLVLSTAKTNVRKQETIAKQAAEESEFLDKYFREARQSLTRIFIFETDYGTSETEVQVAPEIDDALREALRNILKDWVDGQPVPMPHHARWLAPAVRWQQGHAERIPNDWLAELVFRQPIRVQSVAQYLMHRGETEENWKTLRRLAAMPRQSPWAKLWLLDVAAKLDEAGTEAQARVVDWAYAQLEDKHEIVRSEAAWATARFTQLEQDIAGRLYGQATSVTRPALAAAFVRSGMPESDGLIKAASSDGPLEREAIRWALEL